MRIFINFFMVRLLAIVPAIGACGTAGLVAHAGQAVTILS